MREFTDLEAVKTINFDTFEPDFSGNSKIYFFNAGDQKYCLKKQADRDRFQTEWDALQKLARNPMSPNPVMQFTQGMATATPYCIVTEWVPGILLGDFLLMLSRNSRMDIPSRKAHLFWRGVLQALEGFLDSMHDLGLSHNDFYLHNILISMGATRPKLMVLDYGNVTRVGETCATRAANIRSGNPGEREYDYFTLSVMGFWMHQAQGVALSSVNDMTDSIAERHAFMLSNTFDSAVTIRTNLFTRDPMMRFQPSKTVSVAKVISNRAPIATLVKGPDIPAKPVIKPIEETKKASAPRFASKSKTALKGLSPIEQFFYWLESLPMIKDFKYSSTLFLLDLWTVLNVAIAFMAGLAVGVARNDGRIFSLSILGALIVAALIAIPTLALFSSGEANNLFKKTSINGGHLSLLSLLTLVAAVVQAKGQLPTPKYILSAEILSVCAISVLWAAIALIDCRAFSVHRSELVQKILIAANACSLALSLASWVLA
ncbi:MAG: hypothetical protein LBC41_03380 [Clostridiales bacterium]|jgi:hypothetical protein|nr:hypothetical protein [Clostridiales bacterium]